MPYFIDPIGNVHFLDNPESAGLLPEGSTQMSLAEYDAMRAPSLADSAAASIAVIKAEAGARITARYPQYKQANLTARAVELIAARQASGPEWEAIAAAWDWIKAVRTESNRVESAILAAKTVADVVKAQMGAVWPS